MTHPWNRDVERQRQRQEQKRILRLRRRMTTKSKGKATQNRGEVGKLRCGIGWGFFADLSGAGHPVAWVDLGKDVIAVFDLGEAVFLWFGEDAGDLKLCQMALTSLN